MLLHLSAHHLMEPCEDRRDPRETLFHAGMYWQTKVWWRTIQALQVTAAIISYMR
jgi:hypothetical protein